MQPATPAGPQFGPPLAATAPISPQRPPDAGATQVAGYQQGGGVLFAPPAQSQPMQSRPPGDDSFVAAGPLPLPPLPPSPPPRRSWAGWAAIAGAVGVVVAIILIVTLVNGRLGGNGQASNTPGTTATLGLTFTPGPGGTAPPVIPGQHIKSILTGLDSTGDSCQNMAIVQGTTTFSQQDLAIFIIFTALNDGNPQAEAGVGLINSSGQLVKHDLPQPINCPQTGQYSSLLDISTVPPGQYLLGVFYSETLTPPQQPEATLPVTITS
jgi:hypothetical protein